MTGPTAAIGAPIVSKDADEQVVTAPVLVPDQPDRERHKYRAENIANVARSFLPDGKIDAMHAGGDVGHPTESYVAPDTLRFDGADRTIPAGTWMVSAKVTDESVWRDIKAGDLTGVSVFGPVRAVYDSDGEQLDIEEIARPVGPSTGAGAQPELANSFADGGPSMELPPAPVGETWTVEFAEATHVSIVDDPAVQAASFVVAKSASGSGTQEQPVMDDEFEQRFDTIETAVEKSAEAAESAAESAEEAQSAAEEAVENAGSDGGDGGGDGGGSDGLDDDLETRLDELESKLEDVGSEGGDGGDGGEGGSDPDFDIEDSDLDESTIEALADAGAIDEDTAEALGAPTSGIEKRLAAIEKSLEQQNGRQGAATQLDALGEDGEESDGGFVGDGDMAAAVKRAGTAGGEGGEDE
ncbi:XkdF-like putative serine protease domain-containing protein [Halococcus sp. AFM35]|uniref:XkdF-like putative serine protease domain-containing protein n=1 Tax=Halococcus sp. AFM35 TaxID=3421653 RepID=UPI003EC1313E